MSGMIVRVLLPRLMMLPFALTTIVVIENFNLIDKFVQPFTKRLVAETHQAYLMVFAYFMLTYMVSTVIANALFCAYGNTRIDTREPRLQKNQATGIAARAYSAHLNLLEGFPGFLAAVVVSVLCKVPFTIRFHMATIFVVSRIIYFVLYVLGFDYFRTFAWMCGMWSCIILFAWSMFPGFDLWFTGLGNLLAARFK